MAHTHSAAPGKTETDRNAQRAPLLAVVAVCPLPTSLKTAQEKDIVFRELVVYIPFMDASGKHQANTRAVSKPVEARTARSEDEVPPAPVADVIPLVRPPGRPRGHPKSGGRRPGSKNKRTLAVEAALRPLVPKAKRKLKELMDAQDEKVAFSACMGVLSYVFGRPVDRKEIAGAGGDALLPQHTDREWARRLAWLLTKPGSGGDGDVAELVKGTEGTEGTDGSAGVLLASERAGAGEAATGVVSAPATSPASRGNGADNARRADGGGAADARPITDSHRHPVSEISQPQKPKPQELLEGEDAYIGQYVVKCRAPQRANLPLSYKIYAANGSLLKGACDGFAGAKAWISHRDPDADLTADIRKPIFDNWDPARPDQYETNSLSLPEVLNAYENRKRR